MRTVLLSLLFAAFLAGEMTNPVLGQSRSRAEPAPQFDDFDDEPDFRHQTNSRGREAPAEEENSLIWLYVIIVLSLLGGGGWYWFDGFDGDGFGD